VGEIDISVQPNLLRALETREAVRLGSRKPVPVDFRIVSATNRDLRKRCQEGAFREDLYYRLSCVTIQLPSLRERVEDIPLLATHFLAECAQRNQTANPGFSPGAMTVLEGYSWPGNLRELKNVVEAGWVFAGGKPLLEQHVRSALGPKLEPDILPVVSLHSVLWSRQNGIPSRRHCWPPTGTARRPPRPWVSPGRPCSPRSGSTASNLPGDVPKNWTRAGDCPEQSASKSNIWTRIHRKPLQKSGHADCFVTE
jgi:DNA-binding NtrC family response regulator